MHQSMLSRVSLKPFGRKRGYLGRCWINSCHRQGSENRTFVRGLSYGGVGCFKARKLQCRGSREAVGIVLVCRAHKTDEARRVARLILDNYLRVFGKPFPGTEGSGRGHDCDLLWNSDIIVLAHDYFEVEQTTFIYANSEGIKAFESSWEEFVGMESSKVAEKVEVNRRQRLLDEVAEGKDVTCFSEIIRISCKGNRLSFKDGALFNLQSPEGKLVGQAAYIRNWTREDPS